jgi:hypothetical protein
MGKTEAHKRPSLVNPNGRRLFVDVRRTRRPVIDGSKSARSAEQFPARSERDDATPTILFRPG